MSKRAPSHYLRWAPGALLFAALAFPALGSAQVKASEAATLSQTIDGTTLTIEYSRPSLRGRSARDDLFGSQIQWGYVWTPGANQATTLEADHDFFLEGHSVPAGKWSVWMVVNEDSWELILDPNADLYHTQGPRETTEGQIRMPVEPVVAAPEVETLAWTMPAVRTDGADLQMQWGDVAVRLDVTVVPTMSLTFEPERAERYVGRYAVTRFATSYSPEMESELEIRYEDGYLVSEMKFSEDFTLDVALIRKADQVLTMAAWVGDEPVGVDEYTFFEFEVDDDDRAIRFEHRGGEDDKLLAVGERIGG